MKCRRCHRESGTLVAGLPKEKTASAVPPMRNSASRCESGGRQIWVQRPLRSPPEKHHARIKRRGRRKFKMNSSRHRSKKREEPGHDGGNPFEFVDASVMPRALHGSKAERGTI